MSLVETDWLQENLNQVKIIDCSWHMPQTQRNGFEEYIEEHIPNAIFSVSYTHLTLPTIITV